MAFFIFFQVPLIVSANEIPLKAAFIRDHQLWIKENDIETQLTINKYVTQAQWSFDGRYLAYLMADSPESSRYLVIYDLENRESSHPTHYDIETDNFKWAPNTNKLAFLMDRALNTIQINKGLIENYENISLGVSDFEWFPNGEALIVSSMAQLLPTGWGPIRLFQVPVDTHLKTTPFYTIETNEDDFFAIEVKNFTWSSDGTWLSFIASPTASLSNDTTTLCVLSSTGTHFHRLGNMLGNKDWIKWAPNTNQLAFVSGEGRFFVENKQLSLTDITNWKAKQDYTPNGYVDLAIEWLTPLELIVARSIEHKNWSEGPVPTSFTSLYLINKDTNEQTQLTFPKNNEIDSSPQVINSKITWFRQKENTNLGEVWIKDSIDGNEYLWLKNIDTPPIFSMN